MVIPIPEDIAAKIVFAFCPDGREISEDNLYAMKKFIVCLRSDDPSENIPHDKARIFLGKKRAIRKYVSIARRERLAALSIEKKRKIETHEKKALTHLARMEKELSQHGITIKDILATARKSNPLLVYTALKTSQENSWRHLLMYFIGGSFLINVAAAFVYERTLSTSGQQPQMQQMQKLLEQQNQQLQQLQKSLDDKQDAQKAPEPKNTKPSLPSGNVIPLELGPYGLWNPKTGENLLTLFEQGKTVALPNSNVSICMKRPAPPPCKNAFKLIP
jgi:hypothetical protein